MTLSSFFVSETSDPSAMPAADFVGHSNPSSTPGLPGFYHSDTHPSGFHISIDQISSKEPAAPQRLPTPPYHTIRAPSKSHAARTLSKRTMSKQLVRQQQVHTAQDTLRNFLEGKEGSSLKAWIKHFDENHDGRISSEEFMEGMAGLGFEGQASHVFKILDFDESGEITLEEVDEAQYLIWQRFRIWSATTFKSIEEMVSKLAGKYGNEPPVHDFLSSLQQEGWSGGCEELLRAIITFDDPLTSLKWLEVEHRRLAKKQEAKKRMQATAGRKKAENIGARVAFAEFKEFLRTKYGSFLRAWRCALCLDDKMVIHKNEFMKACNQRLTGFSGSPKAIWKVLDADGSGLVSIDEFEPKTGEMLAHFQHWLLEKFGSTAAAFAALDKDGSKAINRQEFTEALQDLGYGNLSKALYHGLDRSGENKLMQEHLSFLDKWKPLPFLICAANGNAADQVRQLILSKYKNNLLSWRRLLDRNNINRCSWQDFTEACKKVGFAGDVGGAWRALDDDVSGYITLAEFDPAASEYLFTFKKWADDSFGGLKSAFNVFDIDDDRCIDFREFRHCCRIYGFDGNISSIFQILDVNQNQSLSVAEISFLDEWPDLDMEMEKSIQREACNIVQENNKRRSTLLAAKRGSLSKEPPRRSGLSHLQEQDIRTSSKDPNGADNATEDAEEAQQPASFWYARQAAMRSIQGDSIVTEPMQCAPQRRPSKQCGTWPPSPSLPGSCSPSSPSSPRGSRRPSLGSRRPSQLGLPPTPLGRGPPSPPSPSSARGSLRPSRTVLPPAPLGRGSPSPSSPASLSTPRLPADPPGVDFEVLSRRLRMGDGLRENDVVAWLGISDHGASASLAEPTEGMKTNRLAHDVGGCPDGRGDSADISRQARPKPPEAPRSMPRALVAGMAEADGSFEASDGMLGGVGEGACRGRLGPLRTCAASHRNGQRIHTGR